MLSEFIDMNKVKCRIIVLEDEVGTAREAAQALDVEMSQIVKSIVVVDKAGEWFLLLVRGDDFADLKKAAVACKTQTLTLATPKQVLDITGYEVGGVPPISLFQMKTVCDSKVMKQEKVFCGGGNPFSLLEIAPSEIEAFVDDFTVSDIVLE
jgi:prolyl-tRNA editing enzyme YbaK/EbsC (Cys-tRNA(Pro) deacylase)